MPKQSEYASSPPPPVQRRSKPWVLNTYSMVLNTLIKLSSTQPSHLNHRLCGGVAYRIRLSHPNHTYRLCGGATWPTV